MSSDRFLSAAPLFADTLARCKTSSLPSFMGDRRRPEHPDEQGASWVVERFFGGRYLFVPDPDHPGWYFVQPRP